MSVSTSCIKKKVQATLVALEVHKTSQVGPVSEETSKMLFGRLMDHWNPATYLSSKHQTGAWINTGVFFFIVKGETIFLQMKHSGKRMQRDDLHFTAWAAGLPGVNELPNLGPGLIIKQPFAGFALDVMRDGRFYLWYRGEAVEARWRRQWFDGVNID